MSYDGNFICISCGSPQVGKNPFNDAFIQNGEGGGGNAPIAPCKYCGGVVIYVQDSENAEAAKESYWKKLGLPAPGTRTKGD